MNKGGQRADRAIIRTSNVQAALVSAWGPTVQEERKYVHDVQMTGISTGLRLRRSCSSSYNPYSTSFIFLAHFIKLKILKIFSPQELLGLLSG